MSANSPAYNAFHFPARLNDEPAPRSLVLRTAWPWWIHPAWAVALLPALTALIAVIIPASAYSDWKTQKYLTNEYSLWLLVLLLTLLLGIILSSAMAMRGGSTLITFSPTQITFLKRAYRTLFILTAVGYLVWIGSAISQGATFQDLSQVLERSPGAISELKAISAPIGGITTLTQFGIVAVPLGAILHKIGVTKNYHYLIVLLAGIRTVFYAERLALIETILPLFLIVALTTTRRSKLNFLVKITPIVAPLLVWGFFAVSEYSRSWIFYQYTTPLPFANWVSMRLLGYYVTAYNNSALLATYLPGASHVPYFTFEGFWNFPGISNLGPPKISAVSPDDWWFSVLSHHGNPELNNTGSFLVTLGELGATGAIVFWLIIGIIVGAVFVRMTKGGVIGMLAVASLFVGLLELPRFTYWTLGRCFPVLIALIILALTYPRVREGDKPQRRAESPPG